MQLSAKWNIGSKGTEKNRGTHTGDCGRRSWMTRVADHRPEQLCSGQGWLLFRCFVWPPCCVTQTSPFPFTSHIALKWIPINEDDLSGSLFLATWNSLRNSDTDKRKEHGGPERWERRCCLRVTHPRINIGNFEWCGRFWWKFKCFWCFSDLRFNQDV